jgi:hypothetical protein
MGIMNLKRLGLEVVGFSYSPKSMRAGKAELATWTSSPPAAKPVQLQVTGRHLSHPVD